MARTAHNTRTSRRLAAALAVAGAVAYRRPRRRHPGRRRHRHPAQRAALGADRRNAQPGRRPDAASSATSVPAGSWRPPCSSARLVSYTAAGSADADGSIAKYEWDLDGDGTFEKTTTGATTSRRYTAPGNITVKVRVTDDDGAKATDSLLLKAHRAPAARITSKKVAVVGEGLTFTSASTDDNGIAAARVGHGRRRHVRAHRPAAEHLVRHHRPAQGLPARHRHPRRQEHHDGHRARAPRPDRPDHDPAADPGRQPADRPRRLALQRRRHRSRSTSGT